MKVKNMIFIVGAGFMLLTGCGATAKITHPYVQEYISGQGNVKGDVDTEDFADRDTRFEIGVDKDGNAVFKNPDEAYDALVEKYSDGISLIKEEYSLDNISRKNYGDYQTYGWQVTGGSDESREQAQFVSEFFDIYENSYK